MRYVLDTHAAIWLVADAPQLGRRARAALGKLGAEDLVISDVTLSELARLLLTDKLRVTGDPLVVLEAFALRFQVQVVSPWIAWRAATYEWAHRDPADRHILATAEFLGLPLVTADAAITPFAAAVGVAVVW